MRRCIVINGTKSDWYERVVFTLKKDCHEKQKPQNLYLYAEELIEGHLKKKGSHLKKQVSKNIEAQQARNAYQAQTVYQKMVSSPKKDTVIQLFCQGTVGTMLVMIGMLIGRIFL